MRCTAFMLCGLLLRVATVRGQDEPPVHRMVAEATVRLASGCTGAIAERSQLIVTAEHCVSGRQSVPVRLAGGDERTAWVVLADPAVDQAVLFLEEATGVRPLRVARQRQIPGTVLWFAGHPDRPVFQEGRLDRVGVCPSLPDLPNALFTSIAGRPGDSGSPLVNGAGSIVGLVHGGARCEIATPADTLLALVQRVLLPSAPPAERAARRVPDPS